MSKNYALKAAKRDQAGKGVARSLRRENKVPGVIYGDKKEPVKIALPSNDINVEYRKGHMYTNLCDMDVDGQKHLLLMRDIQLHPVTDAVMHADFLRVNEKTMIAVEIPVEFLNEDKCEGLKEGGILNIVRHEVELMCSAMNIPESIQVNLEGKVYGDSVRINDAILPPGTKPVIERNFVIATLLAPKSEAEIAAELAAETVVVDPTAVESTEVSDAPPAEGDAKAAEGAKKPEGDKAKKE